MASAKSTAKKPADLDVGPALDEVEAESKVKGAKDPKAFRLYPNSTFAQRSKSQGKRVGSALNKAVTADESASK